MLNSSEKMSRLLASLTALLALFAVAQGSRWEPAEEWEDADLAVFFTGELRGYVEPCG
jgi:hypothetical protein